MLAIATALVSCASSPRVQFFTLDPAPPAQTPPKPAAVSVQIARVRIPPTLDRQQIVRETAPYALDINDQHRWSAPLDQMFEDTLRLDLRNLLPPHALVPAQAPAGGSRVKVVVDVDRFMIVPSGVAELTGSWSLTPAAGSSYCTYDIAFSQPPDSASYADQVKAMSALVARLADTIASTASAESSPDCPR